ncbi:MAG: preprotein translocase subunit SecG [Alphaproteobacteria bacterium]|nr:preprotein translocase subunit SecG [Rhizobiaceae bacterium]MBU3960592.1 preprotein translocase subunit SecG [Alphaproteobacteria bacterium]MBU4049666.1 preprotein translocase subunit SecG [Alphaproteobacteria bacterium]MBU4090962.1 preprotein translocase subunit SecG [Alphaproteobacteria bacterium]MBU4154973.1 preprotein translocase subunit SecG [Alphaproteobacteria bacterium]
MQTVLIVIHLMIVLALVGVVLIQRSEGGGLGVGGGSGFMSARGTANALTRTTAILATLFFITSLGLGLLARYEAKPTDILDRIPAGTAAPGGNVLDQLPGAAPATTPAPATNGAAAPAANGAAAPAPAAPKADPNAVPTGN